MWIALDGTEYWCKTRRKSDLCFQKWHEGFGKFSPKHLKVSKLGLWRDSFIQRRKFMSFRFTGELFIMTMKNDAKLEEKLTCRFKIDMRNLTNFDPSTRKSQNLHFNRVFLIKVYNAWAKKVQRSYTWWHCWLMQNLKENWFVVLFKMSWRICQIFVHRLKNSDFILEIKWWN